MAPTANGLPMRFPCWCKAVYSWGGETKRDLGFIEGDLIECLNAGDGSWWMGRLKRDRRMVGLFPSNFVELLPEDFQPWSRNTSPMTGSGSISRQNSAQPVKQTPQKAKTFRKPFTAYAAAQAPNPAAAARQIEKAGGVAPSPNGSLRAQHKPYASMKRSSTESRDRSSTESRASPLPSKRPSNLRAVSPRPSTAPAPKYTRAPSPAPPNNYQDYSRSPSPAPPVPPQQHPRAVSPAPPTQYQAYSRSPSPAPPAQYRPASRAVSPAPPTQYRPPSRAVSPAPSFQYRAYDRGPSPSPYQDEQFRRQSMVSIASFQDMGSPPPPPPPPHRVAYNPSRAPSPMPPQHGYHTPEPPSPDPRTGSKGNFTPSPLTNAMGDVMSALQDMSVASPGERATPPGVWSPEAFDEVYKASARNKARAQTSIGISNDSGFYDGEETFDDGPPQVHNYVQRMESRLRRMHQQEGRKNDELFIPGDPSGQPPAVPPKNKYPGRPGSVVGETEDMERRGSKTLRHRKSAYEIGKNVLGRTFTTKTTSTTTTHTSSSTNRSLMSGASATNMSSTSAGSYYRKKFARERPKSVMEGSRGIGKGFGFDDGRPESPFTGVTYHSSHASGERPGSNDGQQPIQDGPDPLGGLMQPTKRKSGFFRKMIDTAKTQAANARSTIASGSISRPGSRAASRAASRAGSRAASRLDGRGPIGIAGGTAVQSNAARDMGLNGSVDWVQVRRDINRSNSLSKNERTERADRCQMMDIPVINPVDILYDSAEGDEGLDGLPITDPTDFSASNLALVDKSARFINSIPLGTTPASLAQGYVCRPYRSDVQRLRAIFTWVSERIAWEEDFEGEIDTRHVLQSKRGCSHEIAIIVAEMCASVGLHAEVVRGYLKTPGEPLDLESVAHPNHFWNAVIVEGEWRIMDCSLAGPTNPKRAQYSNAGSSVAEIWYFLARPMEVCYSHVPLLPEQQHICPPQPHDVLMALPCATPIYFKHNLHLADFDTSLLNLDNLEMTHIYVNVPEDVECVAEVEARAITQDADGDYFESGDIVRKPALAQAEWIGGQKRYTVKAVLPSDEGHGVLKVYAGPRGLMHSNKLNPHSLALGLPITHTGTNPPYSFLTLHPTPHAQRHDLYVAQPQCANIALNNTFVFTVRQHPSSLTRTPEVTSPGLTGRASPNPFARPASAMSMQSVSASGSNYTNPSQASSSSSGSTSMKPAKLAVQTPSGKIIRLTRKSEHMSGTNDGDGSSWETVIKIGEKGTWRGLVLADRSARWCVFAQWECA